MSENYPSDWDTRRKKVYKRDNYRCQNCGREQSENITLHAHHIVPKNKGGTHLTTNLVTLCSECHKSIHSQKDAPTKRANGTETDDGVNISNNVNEITEEWNYLIETRLPIVSEYVSIYLYDLDDEGFPAELDEEIQETAKQLGRLKLKIQRNEKSFVSFFNQDMVAWMIRVINALIEEYQTYYKISQYFAKVELSQQEKEQYIRETVMPKIQKVRAYNRRFQQAKE